MYGQTNQAQLVNNPLGGQAGGDQGGRHTGAGMGAGAHEVQVVVARVAVARAQVPHLQQVMRKPVRGPLHQVVALAPG